MKNHYFLSQPHQPFFVLAFTNAIVSMLIFMLLFKGTITAEISANTYHAYSLIFLMMTPAFLAFLFTTFPRFSNTDPIEKEQYLKVLLGFLLGSIFFLIGLFISKIIVGVGIVLTLLSHMAAGNILVNIYKISKTDKSDQTWILISIAFGLIAHLLFFLSILGLPLQTFSIQVAIYLYLFLLTYTIAQRMVPFFSNTPIQKNKERFEVIVGLLILHVLLETIEPYSSFVVDLLLAYLLGKEILRWKLPFPNINPLLWVLHIALFWVPISFLLSAITNFISLTSGVNFLLLDIHTLVLGFIVTILIGFGTRVTLGHSGNIMKANRWATLLFYWTQVVVFMRVLTSFSVAIGWNPIVFFDISITVWVVLFAIWARQFFTVLIFGKKIEEDKEN